MTKIKDDILEVLTRIRNMMHVPVKAKCEYDTLTEGILRFVVEAKQEDGESLMDYYDQHKQAKKIFEASFRKDIIREYLKKTSYYKNAKEDSDKKKVKDKA